MSLLRKFKRQLPSRDAVRKILFGLTAFSLFTSHAHASEITDKDGASLINPDESVHNLYAQELDGNLARSVYDDFNLDQNEIANMHFNQRGGSTYAFNLVNFVNAHVDINGTLNAIRDGAVDGNLYFLSPEGIAVGASGVINAGGFTAYAVDSSDFKDLRDGDMDDLRTQLATNINNGFLEPSDKSVEINGVINARNRIALRGQEITVGKDAWLNAQSDINFSGLVNAGSTVNTLENLNMTVDPEGSGDIFISVSAEHVADDSILDNISGTAPTVWLGNKSTTLKPAITVNGALSATGDISLAANSNTQFSEGSILNLIGTVKAGLLSQSGIDIDADWVDKTNNATITVDGIINAGGNISLDANASTTVKIVNETPGKRTGISNLIPTLSVVYAQSDNNAVVDVNGEITAGGNVTANANAKSSLLITSSSTSSAAEGVQSSVLYTAVGIANVDNKSEISFDNTVSAGGNFSANASGNYSVINSVSSSIPDSSFLATAVGVNAGNNFVNVNINDDITAGGAIDINADNKNVTSRLSVNTNVGKRNSVIANPFEVKGDGFSDALFGALGNWVASNDFINNHSFNLSNSGEGNNNLASNILSGDVFKAGLSVAVLADDHDANVNVADGVKLTANNDLKLNANLTTAMLHSDVSGAFNNHKEGSDTKFGIGGALNISNVDKNANVIVGKNAALSGNNVAVNSNAHADYDQFIAEMNTVKNAWQNLIDTCKEFGLDFTTGATDEVEDAINDLDGISDKLEYAQKMAEIRDKINERYNDYSFQQFTSTLTDGANIYTSLKAALKTTLGVLDPANYVNFYARSYIQDDKSSDAASNADIAGSIQILGLDVNALTLMGEGVNVIAKQTADITSNAGTDIVELTGVGGKYLAAADLGAGTGIGASVVINGVDSYATTAIGKNNQLNANTLNVTADNQLDQIGIIYGSGMAGSIGVSGMMNMLYGDSFALASIDDQSTINAPSALNVKSNNDTNIIAVTGGVTLGDKSTAAAVGAGFNFNNFDVHSFATIADNSSDQNVSDTILSQDEIALITNGIDADIQAGKINSDERDLAIAEATSAFKKNKLANYHALDVESKRIDAVKALRTTLDDHQINLLGTASTAKGYINAGDITIDANTDGTVNSVAIEGSYIGDSLTAFDSVNKILNGAEDLSIIGNSMLSYPGNKLSKTLGGKASGWLKRGGNQNNGGNPGDAGNNPAQNGEGMQGQLHDDELEGGEVEQDEDDIDNDFEGEGEQDPLGIERETSNIKIQIAGAGSIAINLGDGDTVALIDNNNLSVNNLNVNVNDDLYNGAYSGGAALQWQGKNQSKTNVTVGAAAAVNEGDRKVDALIANSNIISNQNGDLNLSASKDGVDVAAASGLAIAVTDSGGTTVNVAAGVGINLADNDVRAMIVNSDSANNVSKFNNLNVHAESGDVQVAGGADVAVAFATGGSVLTATASYMMSDIDNDLQAGIFNGTHHAYNVDISTVKSDTQVNAALSVGVSSSNDTDYNASNLTNPYSFTGTITLDDYTSTSDAFVDSAVIHSYSVNLLNDQKSNANSKRQTLLDQGLDITGSTYLGDKAKDFVNPDELNGSVIVGAAVGAQTAVTFNNNGSAVPVGASIALNYIDVDDNVSIKDSTINSDVLVADSIDKLSLVNVSAGIAASYSGQADKDSQLPPQPPANQQAQLIHNGNAYSQKTLGSVGWNVGSIDNAVNISGSNINSHTVDINSDNQSNAVNVAGEISLGDALTVGLGLASNELNCSVQANLNNSTFYGFEHAVNSVDIDSNNLSNVVEVAACLNVSTSSSVLNANIATNKGSNNTVANIDRLNAFNIDWLNVNSVDRALKITVAGDLNLASNWSLGAGVAYSRIGTDDNQEFLAATIRNSNIHARQGSNISLNAQDQSSLSTTAAGIAVVFDQSKSGNVNYQFNMRGAGAASYIDKDVDAGLHNSNIFGKPDLDINAKSAPDITNVAALFSGSNKAYITAAVGVASSHINQHTDAFFKNDALNETANEFANFNLRAESKQEIASGVGAGAIELQDTSILTAAGSGSYVDIASNTNANVNNINANAAKNFGVVAQSDDILSNYAGTIEISGGTVGLGVSASNNNISGDTSAKVTGSTLNVTGSELDADLISVHHAINDGILIDQAVTKNTWTAGRLADNRSSDKLSGIVVDASSTHGLSNDLASIAVQFADHGISVAGSLNFSDIGGSTSAAFDNSSNGTSSNFNLGAYDFTNKGGFIGGAAGASCFAAGVSSDWTTVERAVSASVDNSATDALEIKANNFNVEALSKQGISDWMLSAAGAVSQDLALETADNLARNYNISTTTTKIGNVNVNFTGDANIRAEHLVDANILNTNAGLSVATNPEAGMAGALNTGIAVTIDESTVKNDINNSQLIGSDNSAANIHAVNHSRINNDLYSIGAAPALLSAGIAGDISVNSLETSTVNNIVDSSVNAATIAVNTKDTVDIEVDGGAGAIGTLAGVGAAVNVNTINNSTNANLQNANLQATDALTINTKEDRNFYSTLVAAGLGGVGAGVNVMVTTVNSDLRSIDSAFTRNLVNGHIDKANEDILNTDNIYGLNDDEKAALQAQNAAIRVSTDFKAREGVLTNVAGSTLKAGGALKINSTEQNDGDIVNGSASAGGVGVAVGDNILHIGHQTKTLLTTSDIAGGSVEIGATQTQADKGLETEVYEVGVGLLEIGVGYNSILLSGETRVDVKGSTVKGTDGDVNITALDDAKTNVYNFGLDISVVGIPITAGKSVNESATRVVVDRQPLDPSGYVYSDLSATDILELKARSANESNVEVTGISGGGLTVAVTTATARDNNKASVVVNGGRNKFAGSTVNLTAESDPLLNTDAPAGSVQILGFTYVDADAEMKGGAEVEVGNGNTFDASRVNYSATTGTAGITTAEAKMKSINGGGISIDTEPNTAEITTETTTSVKVGSQTYENSPAITVESVSQIGRDAYANGYTIGLGVSSGRDKAEVDANDKVVVELGSDNAIENKASSLTITAVNNNLTDLKATGGTGGVPDIASMSTTENDNNTDVTAKLDGKWTVDGAVAINASSTDTVRGYVRQGHGGLAGGSRIRAYDDINGTTTATIGPTALITAGSIEVTATNTVKTDGYRGEESYTLADYYGGGLTIDGATTELNVDKKAYADVGSGASITTTGAQTYTALSAGDVTNKANVSGGGLISSEHTDADTSFKTDNQVRFAKNSKVTATDDSAITVKASDLLNLESASLGTNGGVVGLMFNYTTNDIERKNIIDVKGTLETAGTVDMEAGGTKDAFFEDKVRQIYVKTSTESNNYTLLHLSIPSAAYSLTENNTINVDGAITSGRDINLRADGGKVEVLHSSRSGLYTNLEKYTGDGVPDLSNAGDSVETGTCEKNLLGKSDDDQTNYISVNGTLRAGNSTKDVKVDISGTVVPADYYISGTRNSGTLTVTSDIDVNYTLDSYDYTTELKDRRDALINLVKQYTTGAATTEDNTAAVAGLLTELERIEEKMRELGMMVSEGGRESIITGGMEISRVKLGDISLSGGNINLNTTSVKGGGALIAEGAPNLTITNTSNAYLSVGAVKLGGESGNVKLRGRPVLTGDTSLAPTLTVESAITSGAGNVVILNNPTIASVTVVDKSNSALSGTYTPHPDLRIAGSINNVNGDVTIRNTRGDIDIASEYDRNDDGVLIVQNTVNVNGKNVYIEANGTLNQGYVEGMVNVGGTPESILRAEATAAQNTARNKLDRSKEKSTYTSTAATNVSAGTDNGRISGNNIYIAALDININGVIQAGYETYSATVNDADVTTLKTELAANNTDALNARMRDASGRYAVNDAGAQFDSAKGYYNYELPVYYDASADKLLTEPLETGGGKVYLSGRIGSTGSGRIFAANGYATIALTNNTELPIEVGNIINNNRRGKITIIDTAADTLTEYTPGQTRRLRNYSQQLKDHFADGMMYDTALVSNNNLNRLNPATSTYYTTIYTPITGLRYNWTQGESTMTHEVYHRTQDGWGILFTDFLFGAVITGDAKTQVESWERTQTSTTEESPSTLGTGGYFTDARNLDTNLNLKAESVRTSRQGPTVIAKDTKVSSYVLVNKYTFTLDWSYLTGTVQSYNFDSNGARDITLGFVGRPTAPISINSKGNVYLKGDIGMSDADAQLNIWSNNGAIRQTDDTYLRTGNLTVRAHNGINGLKVESIGRLQSDGSYEDSVELDVINLGGEDVDIKVTGGTANGHALNGDVYLRNLINASSDDTRGDLKVTATGSIVGASGATGHDIVLTSDNGAVGTSGNQLAMRLDASGAVDVTASGDINIGTAYDKPLTIGRLSSANGRVFITKNGLHSSLEQSSTYQSGVKKTDDETLIRQWIDQGLIAPTADYPGEYLTKLNTAVRDYETAIANEYASYESGKEAYAALKTTAASEYAAYLEVNATYTTFSSNINRNEFQPYLQATNAIRTQRGRVCDDGGLPPTERGGRLYGRDLGG